MSSYDDEYYPDEDLEHECSDPPVQHSRVMSEPEPEKVRTPEEIAQKRAEIYAQGPFFW